MRNARFGVVALATLVVLPFSASAGLLFDGSEFQVNTYTTDWQANVDGGAGRSVARNPDGSFVVVWNRKDADGYGLVVGRRFDSTGAGLGTDLQLNNATVTGAARVAISSADDGGFVVVWDTAESTGDGSSAGVKARRYDSAGTALGTEFQVNTNTLDNQIDAAVASAADGRFVVVWRGEEDADLSTSIQGQRFNSSGAPAGTEFKVNTYTTNDQRDPAVASAADGSFVVVWENYYDGISGQRFDSAGAAAGSEFQVNTFTTSYKLHPAVASAADGRFVVVWDSLGQDGSFKSIHGQRYDSTGNPTGTEFRVNTYTTDYQNDPAVSMAADGSFAVVWESDGQDGSSLSVHAQRYDSSGAASGTELQVNTYTTGVQGDNQSIAVDAGGNFAVVWQSTGQDGSQEGMFGQLLCNDANDNSICDSQELCSPTPATGCLGGAKASLKLKKGDDPSKDQIKWKLGKGDAFVQALLGDPSTTRLYKLCIYDGVAGVPSLVASLPIAPGTKWTSNAPEGFGYKDKDGVSSGVTKASLKAGQDGKAQVSVKAKGANVPMPAPLSPEYFSVNPSVTVQLVNNEDSTCWTSEFLTAKTNTAEQFKAKAKGPCGVSDKCIFITSETSTGNLGGLAGADAKCNELASKAKLPGTYVAWLSDGGTDVVDRVTSNGPYVTPGGDLVATSFADLTDGSLSTPIDEDENGTTVGAKEVWTGSSASGLWAGYSCDLWTSSSAAATGVVGVNTSTSVTWTEAYQQLCDRDDVALYCIQQ